MSRTAQGPRATLSWPHPPQSRQGPQKQTGQAITSARLPKFANDGAVSTPISVPASIKGAAGQGTAAPQVNIQQGNGKPAVGQGVFGHYRARTSPSRRIDQYGELTPIWMLMNDVRQAGSHVSMPSRPRCRAGILSSLAFRNHS